MDTAAPASPPPAHTGTGAGAETETGAGTGTKTETKTKTGRAGGRALVVLPLVPSLALAVLLPWLGRAPLWRDEVATVVAASKTPGALARMLVDRTDASDSFYYAVMGPLVRVSTDAAWLRLPSWAGCVLAVAVTCATARTLAARAWGPRAGAWAGVGAGVGLLAPAALWVYAEEARPYALALAATTVSTHLLVTALGRGGPSGHWGASGRWRTAYTAASLLAVWLHPMTVLLLAGHALAVLAVPVARPLRSAVLTCLALVAVLALPLAVVMAGQSGQTSFAALVTGVSQLQGVVVELIGGYVTWRTWTASVLLLVGVLAAVVGLAHRGARWRVVRAQGVVLGLAAGVPVVVLTGAGVFVHLLLARYLLWVLSPLAVIAALGSVGAVIAGAGLARVVAVRAVAALALVTALALAVAGAVAAVSARVHFDDDLPAVAAVVAAHDAPGDAIVYSPTWVRPGVAYFLDRRRGVVARDVAVEPGVDLARWPDLYPPERPAAATRAALAGSRRVWVVSMPGQTWRPTPNTSADVLSSLASLPRSRWRVASTWEVSDVEVALWVQQGSGSASP